MAGTDFNIQDFARKPFKYGETVCPFQSKGNVAVYCDHDCALFVVRFSKVTHNISFAGCALHYLPLADVL